MKLPAFDPFSAQLPTGNLPREAQELTSTYFTTPSSLTTGMPDIQSVTRAFPTSMGEAIPTPTSSTATGIGAGLPPLYSGSGGTNLNPVLGQAISTAQNVGKYIGDPLAQVGLTAAGSPMSDAVTEAAGLVGGSGMGTAVSSGPGMASLGPMLSWAGAATPPITKEWISYLGYIPIVGSILQTIFQLGTQIFEGPPNQPLGSLQQNATVGQQRAGLLNKFLQQTGAPTVTDPYSVGVTGRNWMVPLGATEAGRKALNFKEYPYIPSTGLPMDDPRYTALMKQLEEINASPEMEGMQYSPVYGTQYVNNPAAFDPSVMWGEGGGPPSTMIAQSGYISGLEYGPNYAQLTPEQIERYGWGTPSGNSWGG